MTSISSDIVSVASLDVYFEAPWLMKRDGVYYLLYADNSLEKQSKCTPTAYHACIAYGTAKHPLGPWTYGGVILGIVSSTTSHPGSLLLNGQWYLIYHNADATNGGDFRRSIAMDALEFDDSVSPPSIEKVHQTRRPEPKSKRTFDRAMLATTTSDPTNGAQYWIAALNDGIIAKNPLPPDYWSSYDGATSPVNVTLTYKWNTTMILNGTAMAFWGDHPAGSYEGVAPPKAWHVEYLTANDSWIPVVNKTAYPLDLSNRPKKVLFEEIKTMGLKSILTVYSNGTSTAGIATLEWYAYAPTLKRFPDWGQPWYNNNKY